MVTIQLWVLLPHVEVDNMTSTYFTIQLLKNKFFLIQKKTSPCRIWTQDPDHESRTYTRSRPLGYGPAIDCHLIGFNFIDEIRYTEYLNISMNIVDGKIVLMRVFKCYISFEATLSQYLELCCPSSPDQPTMIVLMIQAFKTNLQYLPSGTHNLILK